MEGFDKEKAKGLAAKFIPWTFSTMKQVITDPVGFFKTMPKEGGWEEPVAFLAIITFVWSVLHGLLGLVGLGTGMLFSSVLVMILLSPVFGVICGFVGGGVCFTIWHFLGSQQPFETSVRCAAFIGAIMPVTALLGAIPYVGAVVSMAWTAYLLVVASVEVHGIEAKKAWTVFGVITALFILLSLSAEAVARKAKRFAEKLQVSEEMTPEEAGRAVGEFMKGLQKGANK